MSKPANRWLNRMLTRCYYFFTLILSEDDFYRELKRLGVFPEHWGKWLLMPKGATAHLFGEETNSRGNRVIIVTMDRKVAQEKDPIVVASLLFHEAVHIWQRHAAAIGSFNDHGDEEEAYAIQAIGQELLMEYRRQVFQSPVAGKGKPHKIKF